VAAIVHWTHQEHSRLSVRSAAHRAGAQLSSGIRRLVLDQSGAACARTARTGNELRGNAGRGRSGCWAGVGVAGAGKLRSVGAGKDQEGVVGVLCSGYAGASEPVKQAPPGIESFKIESAQPSNG